ncbi:hypothetical protein N7527_002575 [Penicillium freii]|nr:hypothetical protein N7527_002575 [Penicillium freii]
MATIRVRAKQIIQAPLPPLDVGAHKTTSSALHNLEYVGTLTPWPNFKSSVEAMYDAQVFSRSSTATVSPGLHNIDPEIVCVGDEHGLQGRFQQAIGQALRYNNVPDIIPIDGTEYQPLEVRQRQAAPSRKHRELDALKDLTLRQCPVVPTLLAYKEGKQGNNGVVPDGYITYVVWDKVPGEPLNWGQVWDPQSGPLREAVRARELRHYGWVPGRPGLRKIIYDEVTGTMHIAGFRYSVPLDPESKFTDRTFVHWGLAIPPNHAGWKKDSTKWAW